MFLNHRLITAHYNAVIISRHLLVVYFRTNISFFAVVDFSTRLSFVLTLAAVSGL